MLLTAVFSKLDDREISSGIQTYRRLLSFLPMTKWLHEHVNEEQQKDVFLGILMGLSNDKVSLF